MGEKVLLVCTSTVTNVRKALAILHESVFRSPRVDLLCNSTEFSEFERQPQIEKILVFPHRSDYGGALRLWRRIFKERYAVVAVLWCLDSGRSRSKLFAFFCGGKRLLVFNENLDCEYLKPSYLSALVASRVRDGRLLPQTWIRLSRQPLEKGYWMTLKVLLLPLRFVILLVSAGLLYLISLKKHLNFQNLNNDS